MWLPLLIFSSFLSPSWTSIIDGFDATVQHPWLLLDSYTLPGNLGSSIAVGIITGTAWVVCDESFFPDGSFNGAAWKIFSYVDTDDPFGDSIGWLEYHLTSPCFAASYLELIGFLPLLRLLYSITIFPVDQLITLGIDCMRAMKQSKSDLPLHSLQPSFDILQDIWERLDLLLIITVHWNWVEGYQDDNVSYSFYVGLMGST